MKHVSTASALLALTLAGTVAPAPAAEPDSRATFDLQGHRGARGLAPENTLAGFARALAIGVTTLELDCGVTKDGVVVVSHDRLLSPDHTRDAAGRFLEAPGPAIIDLTYERTPPVRRRPHQAGERVCGVLSGAAAGRWRAHPEARRRLRTGRAKRQPDRALQHRDQDRPGASRADGLGAGLRARRSARRFATPAWCRA